MITIYLAVATVHLLFWSSLPLVSGYRPVILIHGIMFDNVDYMIPLAYNIQKAHPGTEVHLMELLQDVESYLPFWYQMTVFVKQVQDVIDKSDDGVHIIGYSQGSIISRGIIENLTSKKVHTYITMAGVHLGVHPGLEILLPQKNIFKVGNNEETEVSTAGLARDPKDFDGPRRRQDFLAAINNEFHHNLSEQFKENICHLDKMILISSPDDGLVVPWQSGLFAYDNADGKIVEMTEQEIYLNDTICLKTLNEAGKLVRIEYPGVTHDEFPSATQLHLKYVIPFLD